MGRNQDHIPDESEESKKIQKHPEVLKRVEKRRLYQNKRVYFDDNEEHGGHPNLIPNDHVIYKDLVSITTSLKEKLSINT